MVNIDINNNVTVTRGDSFKRPLFLNSGTDLKPSRYILKDSDEVYLGIMEPNQPFENSIVRKKFTKNDLNSNGDVVISISSSDTEKLIPGTYYYQIKAKFINEDLTYDVNTVVQKTKFVIEE